MFKYIKPDFYTHFLTKPRTHLQKKTRKMRQRARGGTRKQFTPV